MYGQKNWKEIQREAEAFVCYELFANKGKAKDTLIKIINNWQGLAEADKKTLINFTNEYPES